mgnify:FL=1
MTNTEREASILIDRSCYYNEIVENAFVQNLADELDSQSSAIDDEAGAVVFRGEKNGKMWRVRLTFE